MALGAAAIFRVISCAVCFADVVDEFNCAICVLGDAPECFRHRVDGHIVVFADAVS